MYCQKCGALNNDGANFCKRCGAPFNGEPLKIQDAGSVSPAEDIGADYLIPNIVVTLMGCPILGVVGCCYSAFARDLKRKGDWDAARGKAKSARTMFWFTLTLELASAVLFVASGGLKDLCIFFWTVVKSLVFLDPPI